MPAADSASSGGHGDLQLVGDLRGGDPAAGLHQQQRGHEAVGAHGAILAEKVLST
jgi:hypothetical protein